MIIGDILVEVVQLAAQYFILYVIVDLLFKPTEITEKIDGIQNEIKKISDQLEKFEPYEQYHFMVAEITEMFVKHNRSLNKLKSEMGKLNNSLNSLPKN